MCWTRLNWPCKFERARAEGLGDKSVLMECGGKGKGLQGQDWEPVGLACNDKVSVNSGVLQVLRLCRKGIRDGPTLPCHRHHLRSV